MAYPLQLTQEANTYNVLSMADDKFTVEVPVDLKELEKKVSRSYDAIYGVAGQNGLKRSVKELSDKIDKLETELKERLRASETKIATWGGIGLGISILLNILSFLGIGP